MNNKTDAEMQNVDHSDERTTENREAEISLANPSQELGFTKNEVMVYPKFFIPLTDLPSPADAPDQKLWFMEGLKHGFFSTSVLIADVSPGAGPPLHLHYTEEVQVLPECRADFLIGNQRFTVESPGVINIPANTPHTFLNIDDKPVRIVTFFPTSSYETNWQILGPNPLLK